MHDAVADRHWSVSLSPMPAHMVARSARTPQKPVLGALVASPPVLLLLLPASPLWGSARQLSVLPHHGRLAPAPAVRHSNTRGWQAHSPAVVAASPAVRALLCRSALSYVRASILITCPRTLYISLVARARHAYPPSHYHLRSISCLLLAFSSPHSPALRNIYFFFKKKKKRA